MMGRMRNEAPAEVDMREVKMMTDMTLQEAIEHAKEVACGCRKCAEEHEQLAGWLEELLKYKQIAETPSDVQPIVYGYWIEDDDGDGRHCSQCGEDYCYLIEPCERYKYCPSCGVEMRVNDV